MADPTNPTPPVPGATPPGTPAPGTPAPGTLGHVTGATPSPTERAEAAKAEAAKNRQAYDAAVKEMTDHAIAQRVLAVHTFAADSAEGLKAMQEDYQRLAKAKEEEAAKASETAVKPMGTSG